MGASAAPGPGAADPGRWRDLVDTRERAELVAAVRAHLGARFGPDAARACFDAGQPAGSWTEIAQADYPRIGLPAAMGGAGSIVDTVAMIEAAGRELVPLPLLSTVLAWHTAAAAGAVREVSPDRPAALAVAGDGATERSGAERLVVLDGVLAQDLVLVEPAGEAAGEAAVVSVADVAGRRPQVVRHVDPSRPVAVFARAGLSARVLAAADATVSSGLDRVLAPARTLLAADLGGIAAAALDRAVAHAAEREQFGRRIGAFQGVKHRLADVYVAVERARSLTRAAAVVLAQGAVGQDAVDQGAVDQVPGTELALLAKAAAGEAAVDATRAYVQVLGAMGMTFEADAHLYFRRAQQTAPILGSAARCYRRAAVRRREARR